MMIVFPRVVAVTTYLPIPADQGDPIRVMMMLRSLNAISRLTVVAVRRATSTEEHLDEFRAQLNGAEIHVVDPSFQEGNGFHRARRVARGMWHGVPPWILSQGANDLGTLLASLTDGADATVLIGEAAGHYARFSKSKNIIWDKANVITASVRANIRALDSRVERFKAFITAPLASRFESRTLRSVTSTWVTSEADARRLFEEFHIEANAVIPSSIAIPNMLSEPSVTTSQNYFWLSSFRYPPNWDGLIRLLEGLRECGPHDALRVTVGGFGASPQQVARLSRYPFVRYVGFVENIEQSAAGHAAAIVPVWAGAGVKLKTLTLGLYLPLIATPCALEGIPPEAAEFVSDDIDTLVSYVASRKTAERVSIRKVISTRELLKDEFSEQRFAERVEGALAKVLS